MPIVFVHGVNVRIDMSNDHDGGRDDIADLEQTQSSSVQLHDQQMPTYWPRIETFLRNSVAQEITDDPEHMWIKPPYWGDLGVTFLWNGRSRPRSPLLGLGPVEAKTTDGSEQGAFERALLAAELPAVLAGFPLHRAGNMPDESPLVPLGPQEDVLPTSDPIRLTDLTADQLGDLLAAVLLSQADWLDPEQQALVALAAYDVAHDKDARVQLFGKDVSKQASKLQELISERYSTVYGRQQPLVHQGASKKLPWGISEHLTEAVERGANLPGFALSRAFAEFRKPLNAYIARFLGDVFTYLTTRLTADRLPGEIPLRVLDALADARDDQLRRGRPDEPLIVLSHSMGGQIVYDLVTYFLPHMNDYISRDPIYKKYADLRIDFWCATASQVGLFLEMSQFLQEPTLDGDGRVAFPDLHHLGYWWNVWDQNDFVSFTVRDICAPPDENHAGVDDEEYTSGTSSLHAHGAYLKQARFYRLFAEKVRETKITNWRRL